MSGSGAINGPATSLRRLVRGVDARELEAGKRMLHAVDLSPSTACASAPGGTALRHKDALDRQKAAAAWRRVASWGVPSASCALAWARISLPLDLRSSLYSESNSELRAARAEDRALRNALRRQLIAFEHLLDDQQRAAFASSLQGHLYNVLGYVFSGYCIYKVTFAIRAIVLKGGAAVAHRRRVRRLLRRDRRRRHERGGERRERGERGGGDGGGGSGGGGGAAPTAPPPRAPSLLHS